MALRLRRGIKTELDNLALVAEGELIFTTDEGKLYVGTGGDGTTVVDVTGSGSGGSTTLAALTDTDLTGASNNDVLTFVGSSNKWEAVAVPGLGVLNLNDLDNVSAAAPGFRDIIQYNGVGWANVSLDEISTGANLNSNIVSNSSSILLNVDNNSFYGNIRAADNTVTFSSSTGDVYDSAGAILLSGNNRVLFGDTEGFHKGDVVNFDETKVLLDHTTEVFHGTVNGDVFGEDSGVIVDALTSRVYASQIDTNQLNTTNTATLKRQGSNGVATYKIEGLEGNATLRLSSHRAGAAAGSGYSNSIVLGATGSDGTKNTTALYASENILYLTQDSTGGLSTEAKYIAFDSTSGTGKLGIGTYSPSEVLDVAGNIKASGTIMPGVYADTTARDAAHASPTNGQMIYLTATHKFQGYANGAWADLN